MWRGFNFEQYRYRNPLDETDHAEEDDYSYLVIFFLFVCILFLLALSIGKI